MTRSNRRRRSSAANAQRVRERGRARRAERAAVERQRVGEVRVAGEERLVGAVHDPGDVGGREPLPQRRQHRQGVDDVAQGARLDEGDPSARSGHRSRPEDSPQRHESPRTERISNRLLLSSVSRAFVVILLASAAAAATTSSVSTRGEVRQCARRVGLEQDRSEERAEDAAERRERLVHPQHLALPGRVGPLRHQRRHRRVHEREPDHRHRHRQRRTAASAGRRSGAPAACASVRHRRQPAEARRSCSADADRQQLSPAASSPAAGTCRPANISTAADVREHQEVVVVGHAERRLR